MRLKICKHCKEVVEVSKHLCAKMQEDIERKKKLYVGGPVVMTFSPYVEDNFTGEPIEVRSREQRDALCKQHGVTYDRSSKVKSNKGPDVAKITEEVIKEVSDLAAVDKVAVTESYLEQD